MDLKDLVVITGMSGIYKIIKPSGTGVLVENIADQKRTVVPQTKSISKLEDIGLYTQTDTMPLGEVFEKIKEKFSQELPVTLKSDDSELRFFMETVIPEYDPAITLPLSYVDLGFPNHPDLQKRSPAGRGSIDYCHGLVCHAFGTQP